MSLKLVEMQVALPRTQDAGKLQEQLQQRGQLQNDQALYNVQKEEEKKRTSVIKQEQKDEAKFHKEHHQGMDKENRQINSVKYKHEAAEDEKHPYKGTLIDFIG